MGERSPFPRVLAVWSHAVFIVQGTAKSKRHSWSRVTCRSEEGPESQDRTEKPAGRRRSSFLTGTAAVSTADLTHFCSSRRLTLKVFSEASRERNNATSLGIRSRLPLYGGFEVKVRWACPGPSSRGQGRCSPRRPGGLRSAARPPLADTSVPAWLINLCPRTELLLAGRRPCQSGIITWTRIGVVFHP